MSKILVVDDAMFQRQMLVKLLSDYEVIEAETGSIAVSKYFDEGADMILMDITMPDMDGIEAVKIIREMDKNVPIVMVSAMGQKNKVVEAIQAGATSFIVKPYKADQIMAAVNSFMKK